MIYLVEVFFHVVFHVPLQKILEKICIFSLNRLLVGIADLTGTLLGIMSLNNASISNLEEM